MKFGKFRINQTTGIALVCVFILLGMMMCNNRTPAYYEGMESEHATDDTQQLIKKIRESKALSKLDAMVS